MSRSPAEPAPRSKYEVIFDEALKAYEKKTGKDLKSDPLLRTLEACKSPNETLSELQRQIPGFDQSEDSDNRLTNWVNPVVNVLYIFAQTIGGAIGLAFKPGAVIFTGIASLLSVVMAVHAVQSAIADLFEGIKRFFIRLKIYVKLPPTEEMSEIIVDVMVHVLHVLALLTKEIEQGKIKKFLKKLIGRSDIEDALRRFEKLTEEESRMVAVQNLKTTQGVSEEVTGLRNNVQDVGVGVEGAKNKLDDILQSSNRLTGNRLRQVLVNWLFPPDLSTNFENATDAHHESTGEWLTQGSVFRNWKESSSLLWINGKPGSGKTVLSSTIIQDINKTEPGHYGFFFFDFKDASKSNARSLLSSLIVQLSDQSNELFDVLLGLNSSHRNNSQSPSVDALTQCLEDMFRVAHEVPIYLIIDALDECPFTDEQSSPRRQVLTLVEKFVKLNLQNLRICITSRPEADIQGTLRPLTSASNIVSLHDEIGQKNDIVNFVRSEVLFYANLRRWREEDKEFAIKTLSEKADGTFRWVTCQLEILRPCLPPRVRRTLEELPGDLDATYERILEKIPSVNRVYTHRLLQCLFVAARPLEVEELAEVLAIEFDVMGGIPKLTEDFRWENQEHAVLSACSSLVSIVNHRGSRRVQFSHFSVLEFLSSDRLSKSWPSVLSYYHIQPESAHTVMAEACLGTLLRLGEHMDKETIESYPLADYAGEFFVAHAKAGKVLSGINNGVDNLLDPDKRHFNTWLWLQSFDWDPQYFDLNPDSSSDFGEQHSDSSNSENPIYPPPVSPLYYTLLFGHTYLAQYLIQNRPRDLGATDKDGRTALHIAAFKSDFDIARMLVDSTRIDVNCRDNKGCTPLHYAMHDSDQESHEDVSRCVELLLERGGVAEAQNNRGLTPLHLAASKMSENTVRLLIRKVVNINLQDNKSQTALHKASRRGHLDIVRHLLDHKANIHLQDNHGSTPLHLAIYHMSWDAVQLFLDHGADVTLQNGKGQAALHQALQRGHPDIIRLILNDANVNADALDNDGSTPLHVAASEAETLSGAQLLLDHGAKINLRNNNGQTALHLVSQRGRIDFMRLLLNSSAIVDVPDNNGFTPLHLAVSKVERRAAELLLEHGANINLQNNKGRTALHRASECGDLLFMEVALAYGADVNVWDNDNLTPLNLAISKLEEPAAQLLAKHGAIVNLNLRNEKGQTSLHLVSQTGHIVLIRLLLNYGADMEALDNNGYAPLHLAISESKLPAAELLLKHGANIDLRNNAGQTPLQLALQRDDLDIIRLLLGNGAKVDAHKVPGWAPPLHLAIFNSKIEAAELLLKHGANIDLRNNVGQTPLHLATKYGDLNIIRLLLENGANVDTLDDDGSTPLHLAITKSKLEAAGLLLKHGANTDLQNNVDQNALRLALEHGHLETARSILENGANVDVLDKGGRSPLHRAISELKLPNAELLLKYGANIDLRDKAGQTPLHLALQHGHTNAVRLLLENGAFVDALNDYGSSLLHLAISKSNLEAVGLLLKHGAYIHLQNNQRVTALHLASQHGDLDIIWLLLENRANVDALDDDGSTPLHLAISRSMLGAAEILLERGANIDIRNNKGHTALHLALQQGSLDIMRLLLENGADVDAPDNNGSTPLHLAIFEVSMDWGASKDSEPFREVIKLLLEHDASCHRKNNWGETPFQIAAVRKLHGITRLLSRSERTA